MRACRYRRKAACVALRDRCIPSRSKFSRSRPDSEAETVAQIARKDERSERLEKLVTAFRQAAFGGKSEKTDPDQFDLALEDLETVQSMRRTPARLVQAGLQGH